MTVIAWITYYTLSDKIIGTFVLVLLIGLVLLTIIDGVQSFKRWLASFHPQSPDSVEQTLAEMLADETARKSGKDVPNG